MSDKRETLPVNATFFKTISELFEKKQKAGILYEDNGVTRANGMLTSFFEKDGKYWFTLDDQPAIELSKLYAVNGIFASDYSEC
ncbi:MAG: hypothetical protein EOO02_03930 [Chitinophagaceae bacterium]|nr:MAG: hypothetical protein EOO02_03930 [Chitinophagaceae bacterium]